MRLTAFAALALMAVAGRVSAQPAAPPAAPAAPPPPPWQVQLGASFVGTSGNTSTSSVGADFSFRRTWPVWQFDATASAVRASDSGATTAERLLGTLRGKRTLTDLVAFTGGWRAERDRFAGLSFRSVLDGGLSWALVRQPAWTMDGITAATWTHETRLEGPSLDDPGALLQALSKVILSKTATTTQRFTFYPDFSTASNYRTEAELALQGTLTGILALKVGYLWRYSNDPVPGFLKSDQAVTASIVLTFAPPVAAVPPGKD